jgi:hypothetical protein
MTTKSKIEATYVETDCIVTHEGKSHEAGGAIVTPHFAIGYVRVIQGQGVELQSWSGKKKLGDGRIVSSWRTPHSFISDRMYQIEFSIAGVPYTGRSAGDGHVWRGKPKKGTVR